MPWSAIVGAWSSPKDKRVSNDFGGNSDARLRIAENLLVGADPGVPDVPQSSVLSLRESFSSYALAPPALELCRSPRLLTNGWLAAVHTASPGLIWAEAGFASIA